MKRKLFPLAIAVFCVATITCAQFQGVIDMKVTDHDVLKPVESTYRLFVKGDMLATELQGGTQDEQHGKFIFRGDKKVFWIINDQEKSFVEISVNEDGKSKKLQMSGNKKQGRTTTRLSKTGNTQTILGYRCEELVTEDGVRVSHIWGTKKLGNVYEGLTKTFGQMAETTDGDDSKGWEDELGQMKIFPLKVVTSQDGTLRETQEVTKIEPRVVEASIFEPPNKYKKQSLEFDMQKMLKGIDDEMKDAREHGIRNNEKDKDIEKMMKEMKKENGADSTKDDEDKEDDDDGEENHNFSGTVRAFEVGP